MFDYYNLDIIPIILKRFKVNNIVISGTLDNDTLHQIINYCENNSSYYTVPNSSDKFENEISSLNLLSTLKEFDAIFLNDDPNWYTIYNELKIIKQNNNEFPLVFICNNIFPHKRRDSYFNPNLIPTEFLNIYSKTLEYNGIKINDGFYHAINENTDKNGVSTAIEDFLQENNEIELMNIKLANGITILYPQNTISQIRLNMLSEEIIEHSLNYDNFSDDIAENKLLKTSLDEKEELINTYEHKLDLHNTEINYKNSQIDNVDSTLNLKNSQIKNFESKLINRENTITQLSNQLNSLKSKLDEKEETYRKKENEFNNLLLNANSQITSLKKDLNGKKENESKLNYRLRVANNKIKNNEEHLTYKNSIIQSKETELNSKEKEINSLKHQYTNQLSELDTKEYCINCYKEQINNNHLEIKYLKKETIFKKLLNPFAYLFLIFKSNTTDISLNIKLYKALKSSNCFDIGYYLNNNKDITESKWCKYFSPELHYVCNGFNEKRNFNKKYFNRKSKKELLEYILNCS